MILARLSLRLIKYIIRARNHRPNKSHFVVLENFYVYNRVVMF